MKLFEIKNCKKSFNDLNVLNDISLSVEEGEVVAVIGPSGSGKSTFLRCLNRLEAPTEGEIYLDDVLIEESNINEVRTKMGMVFQNFNLFPHYSVIKNIIDAPVHVQKRNKKDVEKEAKELLSKMGLTGKENYYPCQLSGGQQQRVAIARALAIKPHILFFDEPTSALDPELTGEILKVIRQLAKEKMTMVIVTHEMEFARDVADRVVFMDGGYIVEQGDPHEVIEHPKEERTRQFLARFAKGE